MDEIKDNEEVFLDMTLYHISETLARQFKEFCRFHSANKFNVGLEILLNSFKEKESYFYLLDSITELRSEVKDLKEKFATKSKEEEKDEGVRTFGGRLS